MRKIAEAIIARAKKGYQFPINETTENWHGKLFPPEEKEVYSIDRWYAGALPEKTVFYADNTVAGIIANEEDGLVGLELRIFLLFSDWCKFQEQSFYQELIQYLDNLRIQKAVEHLAEGID